MKTTLLIISTALGLLASQSRADRLVIKGSDTLGAKLVPQLAEAFKAQHPDTTFDIAAEGSTTGIAAIIDGTAQIGMSSRRAKPAEIGAASGKGVNMKPTIVAYDGLGVIVNASNPIKGLTKKQVEQIFTGDVTDWSAVGGGSGKISIYTRNTPSAQKMAGHEQIAAEVGKNANGVGYVGLAYMKAGGIKVVPIDGQMPTQQAVIARHWPYARPTFYYTNGEPSGVAREFLEFTISPAGQKIVDRVGFVPIKAMN